MPFRIVDHGSAKAWYGDVKTMLPVSNDPSAFKGLGELLRRCRYAVISPREASAAFAEIVSGERIDLVITDHRLNNRDDLAILKASGLFRDFQPAAKMHTISFFQHQPPPLCSPVSSISVLCRFMI
jgi:hypothetical protein